MSCLFYPFCIILVNLFCLNGLSLKSVLPAFAHSNWVSGTREIFNSCLQFIRKMIPIRTEDTPTLIGTLCQMATLPNAKLNKVFICLKTALILQFIINLDSILNSCWMQENELLILSNKMYYVFMFVYVQGMVHPFIERIMGWFNANNGLIFFSRGKKVVSLYL